MMIKSIHLNDISSLSVNYGIHVMVYQGLPYKIDNDTYGKLKSARDEFNNWSIPIRDKILELQIEIYNYPAIVIEVNQ